MESCHHKNWLYNILKGQMLQNCTNKTVYTEKATKVGQRFINKVYDQGFIEETIKEVADIETNKG